MYNRSIQAHPSRLRDVLKGMIAMFKKILSLVLAVSMVAGMSLVSSAAVVRRKSSTSTSSSSSAVYDLCTAQDLSQLESKMHKAFVTGLRNEEDTITLDVSGYSEKQVGDAFVTVMQMIIDQHAEIFWLDPSMQNFVLSSDGTMTFYPRPVSTYGTANKNGTAPSKLNTSAISSAEKQMESIAKSITGSTRYELVKNIHDYIVKNSTYYDGSQDKASYHEATGVLLNGKAMCDGYAKAFKYLCDQKGIPAVVIGGTASNALGQTGTHAWNYVKMEDGKWYSIDTGWDDPVVSGGGDNSKYRYVYFLKSTIKNDARKKDNAYAYPTLSASDYAA